MTIDVQYPCVDPAQARREYDIGLISEPEVGVYDSAIFSVAHEKLIMQSAFALRRHDRDAHVLVDMKSKLLQDESILGQ